MRLIAEHHIGLAIENSPNLNRALCRTNKLYTYPLCGCWTLASCTPAQEEFYAEHPDLGEVMDLNDGQGWATRLAELASSLDALSERRKKAWAVARDHLNWSTESTKLLGVIHNMLGS